VDSCGCGHGQKELEYGMEWKMEEVDLISLTTNKQVVKEFDKLTLMSLLQAGNEKSKVLSSRISSNSKSL
jgi:hypothetical protein